MRTVLAVSSALVALAAAKPVNHHLASRQYGGEDCDGGDGGDGGLVPPSSLTSGLGGDGGRLPGGSMMSDPGPDGGRLPGGSMMSYGPSDEPSMGDDSEDQPTDGGDTEDEPTEDEPTEDEPTEDEPTTTPYDTADDGMDDSSDMTEDDTDEDDSAMPSMDGAKGYGDASSDGDSADGDSADGDSDAAMLDAHNRARALHADTSPLVWDEDLAIAAEADIVCGQGHNNHGEAGYGAPYGQNFWSTSTKGDAVNAIFERMYEEEREGNGLHFTQIVWQSTKKVGCHIKDCDGMYTGICNYYPAGNMAGDYGEEVGAYTG